MEQPLARPEIKTSAAPGDGTVSMQQAGDWEVVSSIEDTSIFDRSKPQLQRLESQALILKNPAYILSPARKYFGISLHDRRRCETRQWCCHRDLAQSFFISFSQRRMLSD